MQCATDEVWVDIPNYTGYYQVSNEGRVRSVDRQSSNRRFKGKILSGSVGRDGYHQFNLYKEGEAKTFKRSRLVAEAFIDNPNNLPVVEHKDDNKVNDKISNLVWGTISSNTRNAYDTGRIKPTIGELSGHYKGEINAYYDGVLTGTYRGRKELEAAGFNGSGVYNVLNGRANTHQGYTFKRKPVKG